VSVWVSLVLEADGVAVETLLIDAPSLLCLQTACSPTRLSLRVTRLLVDVRARRAAGSPALNTRVVNICTHTHTHTHVPTHTHCTPAGVKTPATLPAWRERSRSVAVHVVAHAPRQKEACALRLESRRVVNETKQEEGEGGEENTSLLRSSVSASRRVAPAASRLLRRVYI